MSAAHASTGKCSGMGVMRRAGLLVVLFALALADDDCLEITTPEAVTLSAKQSTKPYNSPYPQSKVANTVGKASLEVQASQGWYQVFFGSLELGNDTFTEQQNVLVQNSSSVLLTEMVSVYPSQVAALYIKCIDSFEKCHIQITSLLVCTLPLPTTGPVMTTEQAVTSDRVSTGPAASTQAMTTGVATSADLSTTVAPPATSASSTTALPTTSTPAVASTAAVVTSAIGTTAVSTTDASSVAPTTTTDRPSSSTAAAGTTDAVASSTAVAPSTTDHGGSSTTTTDSGSSSSSSTTSHVVPPETTTGRRETSTGQASASASGASSTSSSTDHHTSGTTGSSSTGRHESTTGARTSAHGSGSGSGGSGATGSTAAAASGHSGVVTSTGEFVTTGTTGTTESHDDSSPAWYDASTGVKAAVAASLGGLGALVVVFIVWICWCRRRGGGAGGHYEAVPQTAGFADEPNSVAMQDESVVHMRWLFNPSREVLDEVRVKLLPVLRRQGPVNVGEIQFRFEPGWAPGKVPPGSSRRPWLCLGVTVPRNEREIGYGQIWEEARKASRNGWNVFILLLRVGTRLTAPELVAVGDPDLTFSRQQESVYVLQKFGAPFYVYEVFVEGMRVDLHPELMFTIWRNVTG